MAEVELKCIENKTGTSVVFVITHLEGTHYGVKVYYRPIDDGIGDWSATETVTPVDVGTEVTVMGLENRKVYEFYPVTVTEGGDEGEVGNWLRVVTGDRITRLRNCIEDELLYYLPPQNIYGGGRATVASDRAYPTATVFEDGVRRKHLFNTVSLLVCRFKILFRNEGVEVGVRNRRLNSLVDEVSEHFENELSAFSSIEGYYDTEVAKVEYATERDGSVVSTATLILDCILKS